MNMFKKKERGFTILLAALIASIVLSVGAAIFSIAEKQVTLSGLGRDSQFAFYAADTGAECAYYWDQHPNSIISGTAFDTNAADAADPGLFSTTTPVGYTPKCDGVPITTPVDTLTTGSGSFCDYAAGVCGGAASSNRTGYYNTSSTYTLKFEINLSSGYCTDVYVTKTWVLPVPPETAPHTKTLIHADGFSTPCAQITTSARTLQRSIELNY